MGVLILRIGLGVEDLLGLEDDDGELLLPFPVMLGFGGVGIVDDPEDVLDEGTPHWLVPVAVPCSPHALVWPWSWSRHPTVDDDDEIQVSSSTTSDTMIGGGGGGDDNWGGWVSFGSLKTREGLPTGTWVLNHVSGSVLG